MWFRRAVVGGHARVAAATSAGFARRTAMPRLVQMHSMYQQQHFQQQQQQQRGRWCSQQPPIQPPSLQSLEEVDAEFTEKAVEILEEVDKDIAGAWDKEIREPAVLFKVGSVQQLKATRLRLYLPPDVLSRSYRFVHLSPAANVGVWFSCR